MHQINASFISYVSVHSQMWVYTEENQIWAENLIVLK